MKVIVWVTPYVIGQKKSWKSARSVIRLASWSATSKTALRIAVSGGVVSPAINETLAILGQARVLNRIDRCLAHRQDLCEAPA